VGVGGDFEDVRRGLVARLDSCWERLEDVVSELSAVHGIADEEILARVSATLEAERGRGS
jgi:hypothetical protein